MTPNGSLLFLALTIGDLFFPTRFTLPLFAAAPVLALVLSLPPASMYRAARQAVVITAPLFAFLLIVWVIVVQAAPVSVLFVSSQVTLTPIGYVSGVASRLLLFSLLVAAVVQRFAPSGVVAFVQAISLPASAKTLVLITLSLRHTIAQAAQRAHTALVAAQVLTARASWANLGQGWRLVQGVWMATLNMSLERLDTKWQMEGLPEGFVLHGAVRSWCRADLLWMMLPALALMLALVFG
ncbi:MAG: hypothetical protein HQL37_13650 [Alphaproteobacteria bacterium]|nr:hypothetical protein [Alphaproteobacteria bacterium]